MVKVPMNDPWFLQCIAVALSDVEYVENWARLRNIKIPRSTIERMVCEATGEASGIARQFIEDVYELIYQRASPPTVTLE